MRAVFDRLIASLAQAGLAGKRWRRISSHSGSFEGRLSPPQKRPALFYLESFRTSARGSALRRQLRRTWPDPARREGCRSSAVRRNLGGIIGSILWRRPLHKSLAGGYRRRGTGSRRHLARGPRTANPGSRRRDGRIDFACVCRSWSGICIPTSSVTSLPHFSVAPCKSWPGFPQWIIKSSDLEKPGTEQGFEAGYF